LRTSFTAEPVADWKNIAFGTGYSPREIDNFEKDFAINKWVDKRLQNYVKNDLGTPKDPVRDLADQGITHIQGLGDRFATIDLNDRGLSVISNIRKGEKLPAEGYATTNAGKEWEFQSDWDIDDLHLKEWSDLNPTRFKNDVGLQKALAKDPNARIFAINTSMPTNLGFDHLIDELSAAVRSDSNLPQQLRITTKDLERMTVPDAVRLVSKINKYRADLAEKATVKNLGEFRQNFPALKTYEDGKAWHELKLPDTMRELPEGYEMVQTKNAYGNPVHAIWDKTNGQWVTGTTKLPEHAMEDYSNKQNRDILDKALKEEGELMGHCVSRYTDDVVNGNSRIFTLRDAKGKPHVTIETNPAKGIEETDESRTDYHDVAQIKGKGNGEVSPKYRAEVIDFLNNAYPHTKLLDVEDLRNINAVDMNASRIGKGARIVNAIKAADPDLPRFISQEEFDALASQHYVEKPPEGHKDGGYIQKFDKGGLAKSPQPGVIPSSFPPITGSQRDMIEDQLFNAQALNISDPAYMEGVKEIKTNVPYPTKLPEYASNGTASAFVDRKNPSIVNTTGDFYGNMKLTPHVLGHEASHTQETLRPQSQMSIYNKLKQELMQQTIENNFQKARDKYPEFRQSGYYDKNDIPFDERLADFAGNEASLPKGRRLVDTPFGKEVFNTPALQNYYHAAVRPMEQKMMPQDEVSPMDLLRMKFELMMRK
jgi:hypothetical protein